MEESLTLKQVANILQVEPSTVRFWEKEFIEFLEQPDYKGQRKRFSPKNLETLLQIKELLQTEQYTIKGAVRRLEMERTMTAVLGIDSNYKTTLFFMFNAILEEMKSYRQENMAIKSQLAILQRELFDITGNNNAEANHGLLDLIRHKWQNKKTDVENS